MAVEEADETVFWLMFIGRSGMNDTVDQEKLLREARELLAIFTRSAKTAGDNENVNKSNNAITQ